MQRIKTVEEKIISLFRKKPNIYLSGEEISSSLNISRSALWKHIEKLRGLDLPILIENMPAFPTRKYAFETSAETISEILTRTGADLLLDLAHARVVASVFGLDVHDYLGSLPLEEVRQIHTSGPRAKGGVLHDAHEELAEEDYRLLAWALERCDPEVMTLEYFKDKHRLGEQLVRIRELVSAC